jgi:outer membrane protein assembly factor BamD
MGSLRQQSTLAWLLLAALALPATGCSKNRQEALSAVEFERQAKAAYEKALETFHDRDWVGVPLVMAEVKREFAGSRWARLAQLRIADAQYHQASFPEAITSYREFLREFPNDEEVPYARYRVILCQFDSRGDSVLSPPLEERDLVNIHEADRNIASFLKDYPNHKERKHIDYMQAWVRGMLARHELYVARYYLHQDKLNAAIARTEYALVNYKSTGIEPEALVLLGETYMKRGDLADAEGAFQIVLDKYPESPFVLPATKFMKHLHEHPPVSPHANADDSEETASIAAEESRN